jgi:GTP 3',8-cyclase / cyclic pyranopterin monophosphate synthase
MSFAFFAKGCYLKTSSLCEFRCFSSSVRILPLNEALKDSFGRQHNYLRISLTERCNLRCVYCMPIDGVSLTSKEELLNVDEYKRIISIFAHLGVNKLRFTGGEPTVSPYLEDLIRFSSQLNNGLSFNSIGITSNGVKLKSKLDSLVSAGLKSVNISLDTLSEKKFTTIARRESSYLSRVLSSIYYAIAKNVPIKVNVVLMRGVNDDEMSDFVALTREHPIDIRFIELMPFEGNEWEETKYMGYFEAIEKLKREKVQ